MWNYNFFVYVITNRNKNVLYIGVTNNLQRRLTEHYDNQGNSATFAGNITVTTCFTTNVSATSIMR
jgi:putative endonuclease